MTLLESKHCLRCGNFYLATSDFYCGQCGSLLDVGPWPPLNDPRKPIITCDNDPNDYFN